MIKKLLIGSIKVYKKTLSPYLALYSKCRYTPTCSEYMMEAIEKHGAIKGVALGIWRLLRCNPWSKGGYDPVP